MCDISGIPLDGNGYSRENAEELCSQFLDFLSKVGKVIGVEKHNAW